MCLASVVATSCFSYIGPCRWFCLILDNFSSFQVVLDHFRLFQLISQMILVHFRWFQVILDCFRSFQLIPHFSKYHSYVIYVIALVTRNRQLATLCYMPTGLHKWPTGIQSGISANQENSPILTNSPNLAKKCSFKNSRSWSNIHWFFSSCFIK